MSAGVRGFSTKPEIIHTKAVAARVRCTILRRNKNKQHSREDNIYETCKKNATLPGRYIMQRDPFGPNDCYKQPNSLASRKRDRCRCIGVRYGDRAALLLDAAGGRRRSTCVRMCAERTSVRLNLERTCSSTLYHIFASIKSLWDDGWMGWSQTMRAHRRVEHLRSVL